jgi:lipid-A-disaccharide synthase
VPQVLVYKGHPISIGIAKMLVKIKFISLVNLIMDRGVIKELIQEESSIKNIAAEVNNLLNNKSYRAKMLADYDELDEKMGRPGASAKAAELIIKYTIKR